MRRAVIGIKTLTIATAIGALAACNAGHDGDFTEGEDLREVEQAITGTTTYLYQHCSYGGYVVQLQPGNYTLSQLQAQGMTNDDLSSMKIPTGYAMQVFQHDNFGGFTATFTGDVSCLTSSTAGRTDGRTWNDDISSLKITSTGGSKKTVGYVVSWVPNISVPYSKLTHINYAFTLPNSNGSLTRAPENPAWLQTVVSGAHNAGGKVLASVGGWMADSPGAGTFAAMANNASARSAFRTNMINYVNAYNLDGIDIDWEYPCPNNGAIYATLMSELASDMHSRGKLLTAAVAPTSAWGSCVGSSVIGSVDFLNLMVYDYDTNSPASNHSTYQNAVDSINYWKGKGLSASKTVLGLPFYSRGPSWSTITSYSTLVSWNTSNRCRDTDGSYYWNGIPTIRSKASYARANAGGVMWWETSNDTTGSDSLATAAWRAVNGYSNIDNCL